MMNRRKNLSFEIALSGIATALSLICTVLYYYSPVAKLSFLALSAVALLLPLTVGNPRGAALSYVATSGLTIAIVGPVAALPYAFIFGWQPVVMGVCTRYLKRKFYISIPLKAALFNAGLYGTYALYGLGDSIENALAKLNWAPAYWVVAIVATVLFLGYDYLMQWVFRWIDRRMKKVTAKYVGERKAPTEKPADGRENGGTLPPTTDIFGEYREAHENNTEGENTASRNENDERKDEHTTTEE